MSRRAPHHFLLHRATSRAALPAFRTTHCTREGGALRTMRIQSKGDVLNALIPMTGNRRARRPRRNVQMAEMIQPLHCRRHLLLLVLLSSYIPLPPLVRSRCLGGRRNSSTPPLFPRHNLTASLPAATAFVCAFVVHSFTMHFPITLLPSLFSLRKVFEFAIEKKPTRWVSESGRTPSRSLCV